MTLSAFIRVNLDTLVLEWQEYASTQWPAAQGLDAKALQDNAAELLIAVAGDMDSQQSRAQEKEKSQGLRPGNAPDLTAYSQRHAGTRLAQGFTLNQMASEYRALRASVLRHWASADKSGCEEVQEVIRFSESMDQSLVEAMAWYGARLEHGRELFLGALGHDLRAPLQAAMLSVGLLLRDERLEGTSAKAALRIFNSGTRITRMLADLLDFTRTRLGTRLPIERSRSDLGALLRQTIDELEAAHPATDFEYDCTGDLWGEWDAPRLAQMLSNLAGNAIQHGAADKPIRVSARAAGETVIVTVHNEGPPIAPEMIGKIFEPLMRGVVQEAEHRSYPGSLGLGLYISDEIAKAHGGGIDVVSTREGGTTFTATLPRMAGA